MFFCGSRRKIVLHKEIIMSNQRSAVLNAPKGLIAALVLSLVVSFGVNPALSAMLSINANPVSVNSGAP